MITKGRNNQMIGYIERRPEFLFQSKFHVKVSHIRMPMNIYLTSRVLNSSIRVKAMDVIIYSDALRSEYLHNLCENELHLCDSFLQGKD